MVKYFNPEFDYQLGNFGEIPYGKSLIGQIIYHPVKDGNASYCNIDELASSFDFSENMDLNSIHLVDQ